MHKSRETDGKGEDTGQIGHGSLLQRLFILPLGKLRHVISLRSRTAEVETDRGQSKDREATLAEKSEKFP